MKATKNRKGILLFMILANLAFTERRSDDYILSAKTKNVFAEGSQRYLIATVILTNNTSDTLKYLSMTCSYQQFYLLKSKTLKRDTYKCAKNIPRGLTLPPHKSDSVELKFRVSENNQRTIEYKIGMMLTKNEGYNPVNLLTHGPMRYTTIWSNKIFYRND